MRSPRALVAGLALVAAATGIAACAGEEAPATPTDPVLAQGQQVYNQQCATCHGRGGGGGMGPKLAGVVEVRYPDIDDQIRIIREGKGSMPKFDQLSDEDLMAVARYEREVLE